MKILAFVDMHGSFTKLKEVIRKSQKADILVCCGDISMFGQNLDRIFSQLSKTQKPILVIPGNHETEEQIRQVCKKYKLIYLHNGSYILNNYVFFGYGGGGFSQKTEALEKVINKFKKTLKKDDKIILITHAPPYKTTLDFLPHLGHVGSKSLRTFIEEIKPFLHICGHLHENDGSSDKINNSLILNPGSDGQIIDIQ